MPKTLFISGATGHHGGATALVEINKTGFIKVFKEVVGKEIPAKKPPELPPPLAAALNTINDHPYVGTRQETIQYFPWVKDVRSWVEENIPKDGSRSLAFILWRLHAGKRITS